tara:strand:- start:557 stop:685 length:129 start_codon:yes stop_codon:yes gene_type:complete
VVEAVVDKLFIPVLLDLKVGVEVELEVIDHLVLVQVLYKEAL